jgi:hypothetical protein
MEREMTQVVMRKVESAERSQAVETRAAWIDERERVSGRLPGGESAAAGARMPLTLAQLHKHLAGAI